MPTVTPPASATGPKTAEGKRIAARNATTHGTYARDVVLPRLGEDPQAYEAFLQELTNQLAPKNLFEQHYAEKIAAASWRLRRLHRQRVYEDPIRRLNETERGCKDDPYLDQGITEETRKQSSLPTSPPSLALSRLDTAPVQQEKCKNEPAACTGMARDCTGMARHAPTPPASGEAAVGARETRPAEPEEVLHTFCQNEPALAAAHPHAAGEARAGAQHAAPSAEQAGSSRNKNVKTTPPPILSGSPLLEQGGFLGLGEASSP